MNICVDFDGTCVTHAFPEIGEDIGAVKVLKELVNQGHKLILFTMRSDKNDFTLDGNVVIYGESGKYLTEAVNWFKENNIPLYGVNSNPEQSSWTSSPKAYGEMYIDDLGLGIPLKMDLKLSDRPFVDWAEVVKLLKEKKVISKRFKYEQP